METANKSQLRKKKQLAQTTNLVNQTKKNNKIKTQSLQEVEDAYWAWDPNMVKAVKELTKTLKTRNADRKLSRFDINKIAVTDNISKQVANTSYQKALFRIRKELGVTNKVAKALIALDDWDDVGEDILTNPSLVKNYPSICAVLETAINDRPPLHTKGGLGLSRVDLLGNKARVEEVKAMAGETNEISAYAKMSGADAVNVDFVESNLTPHLVTSRMPTENSTPCYSFVVPHTSAFNCSSAAGTGFAYWLIPSAAFTTATTSPPYFGYESFQTPSANFALPGPLTSYITFWDNFRVTAVYLEVEIETSSLNNQGYLEAVPFYDAGAIVNPSAGCLPTILNTNLPNMPFYRVVGAKEKLVMRTYPSLNKLATPLTSSTSNYPGFDGSGIYVSGSGLAANAVVRFTSYVQFEVYPATSAAYSPFTYILPNPGYYTKQWLINLYQMAPQISFLSETEALALVAALKKQPPYAESLTQAALDYLTGFKVKFNKRNVIKAMESECSFDIDG